MTLNERIAMVKGKNAPTANWSGSIIDAWLLVDEVVKQNRPVELRWDAVAPRGRWVCRLAQSRVATGQTAPEAICHAYLTLMGDDDA